MFLRNHLLIVPLILTVVFFQLHQFNTKPTPTNKQFSCTAYPWIVAQDLASNAHHNKPKNEGSRKIYYTGESKGVAIKGRDLFPFSLSKNGAFNVEYSKKISISKSNIGTTTNTIDSSGSISGYEVLQANPRSSTILMIDYAGPLPIEFIKPSPVQKPLIMYSEVKAINTDAVMSGKRDILFTKRNQSKYFYKWLLDEYSNAVFSIETDVNRNFLKIVLDDGIAVDIPNIFNPYNFQPISDGEDLFFPIVYRDAIALALFRDGAISRVITPENNESLIDYGRFENFIWIKTKSNIEVVQIDTLSKVEVLSKKVQELSISKLFYVERNNLIAKAINQNGSISYYSMNNLEKPKLICRTEAIQNDESSKTYWNFPTTNNYALDLITNSPKRKSNRAIVYLHGGPYDISGYDTDIFDVFTNDGYDVIHVNYPGSLGLGASYQRLGDLTHLPKVVKGLREFFESSLLSRYDEVQVIGHSYGAFLASLMAKEGVSRIDGYHLVNGFYDLEKRVEDFSKAANASIIFEGFSPEIYALDKYEYDERFDPSKSRSFFETPVFFYYDLNDRIINQDDNLHYQKKMEKHGNALSVPIDIGGHYPDSKNSTNNLISSIRRNLKPNP